MARLWTPADLPADFKQFEWDFARNDKISLDGNSRIASIADNWQGRLASTPTSPARRLLAAYNGVQGAYRPGTGATNQEQSGLMLTDVSGVPSGNADRYLGFAVVAQDGILGGSPNYFIDSPIGQAGYRFRYNDSYVTSARNSGIKSAQFITVQHASSVSQLRLDGVDAGTYAATLTTSVSEFGIVGYNPTYYPITGYTFYVIIGKRAPTQDERWRIEWWVATNKTKQTIPDDNPYKTSPPMVEDPNGVGSASGTSTATGVGQSTGTGVGSASGTGAANGAGLATVTGTGTAPGVAVATGRSSVVATTTGTAASVGTAMAAGSATFTGTGSAASASTATAAGSARITATGTATGTGAATGYSGTGAPTVTTGTSAGVGVATGAGQSVSTTTGSATSNSTATGQSSAVVTSSGSATSLSTATATGVALIRTTGSAAATSTATGAGSSRALTNGTATGSSNAVGFSPSAPQYPAPKSRNVTLYDIAARSSDPLFDRADRSAVAA